MKTCFFLCAAAFVVTPVMAAPRLVVSTASISPESKIDVVFEQAVTAPAELAKPAAPGIEITPAWRGGWKWKSPEIAEFVPEELPGIGVKYEFRMAKGKAHLDGSAISAGKFGEATAESFNVLAAVSPNRWARGYHPSTGAWLVVFNDAVDASAVAPAIRFVAEGNRSVAAKVSRVTAKEAGWYGTNYRMWADRRSGEEIRRADDAVLPHVLLVSPASPLFVAEQWALVIGKGAANAGKSATLPEARRFPIGNIRPFEVTKIDSMLEVDQAREIRIFFNQNLAEDSGGRILQENIVIHPQPQEMRAEARGSVLAITGRLDAKEYNVAVRGPLQSAGQLPLSNHLEQKVRFTFAPTELALPSEQQGQLARGLRSYAIRTVNLEKIVMRVKQLKGSELVRAVQGYEHYTGVGNEGKAVEPTAPLPWALVGGETIATREYKPENAVDTSQVIDFRWDEVLPEKTETGALFVEVTGEPRAEMKNHEEGHRRNSQAIVQLTDIGLAWKFTDAETLIHAFSCNTGAPLAGVKLVMFAEDAALLDEAVTGAEGIARLPRKPNAITLHAVKGDDEYATAFDSGAATVGLWHFPVRFSHSPVRGNLRKMFLFSDRSVYRPGETVRVKGILRTLAGNEIDAAERARAEIVLYDPADKELLRKPLGISDQGSFEFTHKIGAETVGEHRLAVEFPDDLKRVREANEMAERGEDAGLDWAEIEALETGAVFNLPIFVNEFRRNAFEVTQTSPEPGIAAAKVDVSLAAKYYQGQPVAAGKVKYYTRITEENPYPERFREFLFGNHRTDDWKYWYHYFGYDNENESSHESALAGETVLTPEGKAEFPITVPVADFPRMRKIETASEVTDANLQTLTARSSVTVHPAEVTIGISRPDRLARAGEPIDLKFVAIDNRGEPYVKPVSFTAEFSRELNKAVKSRAENGETTTQNNVSEEIVETAAIVLDPAASAKDGQAFRIVPKAAGLHFLTVRGKDAAGRDFATVVRVYVYGTDEFPWKYEEGIRVKLVADKKSYKPGETAKVLVLSPIEGRAIVTVEREKVLHSFVTDLKMDKPVIEIPVTDETAPNAFVSVLIVKGARESAREIKEPQLRLGYCELMVENRRETLTVAFDPLLPVYRPGLAAGISGTVRFADGAPAAGAEVTLYAEDEGTLAVMGYETPDPMKFFYSPRMLAVATGTSFHTFISEDKETRDFFNKGFVVGGGGDVTLSGDVLRKKFDPCAFWAPRLRTDSEGRFRHDFTLPDTLTRYRVIAVASHAAARFGRAESTMTVKKNLMLEPKPPRAAHQGDKLRLQALVQNSSEVKGTWEIRLVAHNAGGTPVCRAAGGVMETVTLAPGEGKTVSFPVNVENTGTALVSWQASPAALDGGELTPVKAREFSDAVETKFEVAYPMPVLRAAASVQISAGLDLRKKLDARILDGSGSLALEFSHSRLNGISGAVAELLRYPYGCAEQTTSALLPWCSVDALRQHVPALAEVSDERVKAALQAGADRLLSLQLADGSFAYWPGGETNDWATPYAGMGLILAAKAGADVPQAAIDSLIEYLRKSLRGLGDDGPDQWGMERHARTLFTLAMAGKPEVSYQNAMADRLGKLNRSTRCLLAAAIVKSAPGNEDAKAAAGRILKARAFPENDGSTWMPYSGEEALSLLAWQAVDPSAAETNRALDVLLGKRGPHGSWVTTWANGWALLAIAEVARDEPAADQPATITVETNAGVETIMLKLGAAAELRNFPTGPSAKFVVSADRPVFMRAEAAAKPPVMPLQPVAKNGLAVDRSYQLVKPDGTHAPLTEPRPGDLIRVTLRVTLPRDDARYLAIEDPLPAIFEAVNSDFRSQSAALGLRTSENDWQVDHSELRDDRAVFFVNHIRRAGTYTLTYLARCTLPGEVGAPPAKAEMMYDPLNFALSASRRFIAE